MSVKRVEDMKFFLESHNPRHRGNEMGVGELEKGVLHPTVGRD